MLDIDHQWGADLSVGPTGDLLVVADEVASRQRIIRRFLTAPGSYLWNPGYGAGLGQYVGSTLNTGEVEAVVRGQLHLEQSVSKVPPPLVKTFEASPGGNGAFSLTINYYDISTSVPQTLNVPIGPRYEA